MTGTWPNTGLDIPLWSKHHHQRRHLELSCGPLCHSVAALVMMMMVAGVMVVVYINKLMLLLVATMLNYNLTMITFNLSLKWVSYRWWQAGRLLSTWLVGSLAGLLFVVGILVIYYLSTTATKPTAIATNNIIVYV